MRILIVYYTRTNTTKKLAEAIKREINIQKPEIEVVLEEVIDLTKRTGGIGYMLSGRDVVMKRPTRIENLKHNPANYDLVLIGSPVWVGTMAPAIREYVKQIKSQLRKIVFFSTQGGDYRQRIFDDLKREIGREPIADEWFTTKNVVADTFNDKLKEFIKKLNII